MSGTLNNPHSLRPSSMVVALQAMFRTNRAPFVWGPPGIAKSAVSQQVATLLGVAFIDIRLSQFDPTDLRGIPYPHFELGMAGVRWSIPYALPRDLDATATASTTFNEPIIFDFANLNQKGSNGIYVIKKPQAHVTCVSAGGGEARIISLTETRLEVGIFNDKGEMIPGAARATITGKAEAVVGFEEFNAAPPSVQAASYQLILDRRIGEYIVPEGCKLMAMGNRDTDKGVAFKMGPALMNRFFHYEMRVHFDDWLEWALAARVHPQIVGYLSAFKEKLFRFDPGTAARGFETPRSWAGLSEVLSIPENQFLPEDVEFAIIAGAIGEGTGYEFHAFRKIAHEMPRAEDILSGALKKLDKDTEVQMAYALVTTICYQLAEEAIEIKRKNGEKWKTSKERETWLQRADNFIAFMLNNFHGRGGSAGVEICVLGARSAIKVHKLPFDTKKMAHFEVFATRFKDAIVGTDDRVRAA